MVSWLNATLSWRGTWALCSRAADCPCDSLHTGSVGQAVCGIGRQRRIMRVTGVALRGLSLLILWTKALWIITEERWLGSCSLWQAGLDARSRNAVINVQLCKWWMACEGWNLPSTTLAKINRGSAIRADPGLWRYPPFTHVSLDFQLIDWPISRSRADSKTLLWAAKTFRRTLSYFRRSITLMFTVTLWNGIMCSDGSEWRFVIAFHAIRGEIWKKIIRMRKSKWQTSNCGMTELRHS